MNKAKENRFALDEAIARILSEMSTIEIDTDEYRALSDQLQKLTDVKNASVRKPINPDTVLTVLGNLLGIGIIVGHEQAHVITSKAMSFIKPPQK